MGTNTRRRSSGHDRIAAAKHAREQAARRRQRRPYVIGGVAAAALVVVGLALLVKSSTDSDSGVTTGTASATTVSPGATPAAFVYGTAPCAPGTVPPAPTIDFAGTNGFAKCVDPASKYIATFDTTAGTIKVDLDLTRTPGTTNNFVQLAGYRYYDGTKLFRTDPSMGIVQGGAPHTNDATDPGPGFTISDEGGGFTYRPGQLVMARGSGPNSAGAQFFFTADEKASTLDGDGSYVVVGTVTEGLDVLQKILATNVGSGILGGAPNPEVTVNSVSVGQASLVTG